MANRLRLLIVFVVIEASVAFEVTLLPRETKKTLGRSTFLRRCRDACLLSPSFAAATAVAPVVFSPQPALAVFEGVSFDDAMDNLKAQRLACDNIRDVVSNANLPEARFKIRQLNAQTAATGKVVLRSLQQRSSDPVSMVRYLKCQEKFSVLQDLCGECEILMERALRGDLGAIAVAQIKILSVVEDTGGAFDDFLAEVSNIENLS